MRLYAYWKCDEKPYLSGGEVVKYDNTFLRKNDNKVVSNKDIMVVLPYSEGVALKSKRGGFLCDKA